MSGGWIDAVAVMEPADTEAFGRALERHVSGLDVTHRMGECVGVALATEEDEGVFRLYLLCERTIADIRRVAARKYIVATRLRTEVDCWLAGGRVRGHGRAAGRGGAGTPGRGRPAAVGGRAGRGAAFVHGRASCPLPGLSAASPRAAPRSGR